jgi:hypothetical protein
MMNGLLDTSDRRRRAGLLIAIALVSVGLWQTQIGSLILYPFSLLATWFHEMGHGLAAILTGSSFDHLVIFSDGSGYAAIRTPVDAGRITLALISAAGPLGPAIVGSLLIVASRTTATSRLALEILGWAVIISTAVWVRSLAGWIFLPALGLAVIALERLGKPSHHQLAVQVIGVQACISIWRSFDYLFSSSGYVGGRSTQSDTAAIANALLLSYWFWGGAISVAIAALLWWSLRKAFRT